MCRVAMDAACAHLVLVGTRNPLRAVVLLDVSETARPMEAGPHPHAHPAREPAPGEAGAEFAISHLVQHLE